MADEVRQVEHYSVSIPNRIAEGARVLGALRNAGVNFIAVWGYPRGTGKAQLELIPENGSAFVAAAKEAKLRPKKSTAFYLQGEDHPGAVADVLKELAEAKIEPATKVPGMPPSNESATASLSSWRRACQRLEPIARRMASSRLRSAKMVAKLAQAASKTKNGRATRAVANARAGSFIGIRVLLR